MLPTYRIVAPLRQLPGASENYLYEMRGAAKANTTDAPFCVANEYVAGEIGRILGLPIPPGGLVEEDAQTGDPMYVSLEFSQAGGASLPGLSRTDLDWLINNDAATATGVLLFDIWIANADRHRGNLSLDRSRSPPVLHVYDHSHALFGVEPNSGSTRLNVAEGALGVTGNPTHPPNRHCLLDELTTAEHMDTWINRIQQVPDFIIERLVNTLEGLGYDEGVVGHLEDFIKERRANIPSLLSNEQSEFTSITNWGDVDALV